MLSRRRRKQGASGPAHPQAKRPRRGASITARATIVWLLLLAIAVLAGSLRNSLLVPWLGEQGAHVYGTLAVAILFACTIWLLVPWIDPALHASRLLSVGMAWLVATASFEFLFGHFVMKHSWHRLLADYDMTAGRLWPLVLMTLAAMPLLTAWLRGGKGFRN